MWTLARLLPVMIGQYIDEDDKHWNHFLQLLEIMEYTFSPTVLPTTPAHLKVIIESNLTSYQELYPDSTFTPKMHYIVHIPQYLYMYVSAFNHVSNCIYKPGVCFGQCTSASLWRLFCKNRLSHK